MDLRSLGTHRSVSRPRTSLWISSCIPIPNAYDDFRFVKIRSREPNPDAGDRAQYAASNPASMSSGFGRHACPGRFFAANEIKAIMGFLVLNYDMKFPAGVEKRPESLLFETQYLPNPFATVILKRRKLA